MPALIHTLRRPLLLVVVATMVVTLPGCGDDDRARDDLEAAIARTRELSNRFVYADIRPDSDITVRGFMEDDFRVKARVEYDGEPGYEQVISDDVLAVRVFDRGALDRIVDGGSAGSGGDTELEGVTALDALATRRWVVDPRGAPLLGGGAASTEEIGEDPVRDALSALDYVQRAVRQAVAVEEYSADDLTPVYAASEDNFPQPEDGSGVKRYDLRRPDLPVFDASGTGGDQEQLGTEHFRKMVVYVKDGVIIRVIERVEAIGSFFGETIDFMRRLLEEVDAPQEAVEGLEEFATADIPEDERSDILLEIINAGFSQLGLPPILAREMVMDLADHGSFNAVELPDPAGDAVIEGELSALLVSADPLDAGEGEEPDLEVDPPGGPADREVPQGGEDADQPDGADAGPDESALGPPADRR